MKLKKKYKIPQIDSLDEAERHALFTDLWNRYGKRISYFISTILPSESLHCDDLFQDVMMKIFENLHLYDRSRPFEVWAYRIVRNRCIDHLRIRQLHETADETLPDRISDTASVVIRSEIDSAIRNALNRLDADDRQIAYLRFFGEMSFRHIAEMLDMNVNTVKTRMTAVKRILKSELDGWL